jgi:GDP-4-dehydro-6-deoxy-D-mannose reductase
LREGSETLKALITGISGFVGSHLAEYLLDHTDWQVAGTVYGPTINITHLRSRLELYYAELSRLETVSQILSESRPAYIFHLAAQPLPFLSHQDPWGTLENNICMQLNILEAVVRLRLDSRVLVVGSAEEYGLVHAEELPIRETTPLRPINPYAVSKVAQDFLGLQYHLSHNVFAVRVRPFNHLGPRQSPGFVAPDLAKQIAEAEAGCREPIIDVGNLDAARDFSDVRDIVRGYHLALTRGEAGEVYNLGSEEAHSVRELLDTLLAMSRMQIEVRTDATRLRPVNVPVIISDCTRFRQRTGWRTTIPFRQSLQDVLDYWRDQVRQQP